MVAEESASALYGGLFAHLVQVIPNAVVMYSILSVGMAKSSRILHYKYGATIANRSGYILSPPYDVEARY